MTLRNERNGIKKCTRNFFKFSTNFYYVLKLGILFDGNFNIELFTNSLYFLGYDPLNKRL